MKKLTLFTIMLSMVMVGATSCGSKEPEKVPSYSISWLDYDNKVLRVDTVTKDTVPFYGSNPTRAADDYYTYEFSGWSPEVVAATKDATYVATYESAPITEINKETFNKAKNLYGKNFTVRIKKDAGYEEIITHSEKNEYYGVHTLDGVSTYRAFKNEHDDVLDYYTGEVNNDKIVWSYQLSGKVNELTNYAFDQYKLIKTIMSFNFDDLTYDSENKCYTTSVSSTNWTFSFSGARLLKATSSFYNVKTTFTFTDFDETKVIYDQYLLDYMENMFPSKETLKSIIKAAFVDKYPQSDEDIVNGDLEFHLTYYENDVNKEYYVAHLEQMIWRFDYDGENKIRGKKDGSYIFIPVLKYSYVLDSGITYVYTEDYLSNPYWEDTFGRRSYLGICLAKEVLDHVDEWENYSVSCGEVSFDFNNRHYYFEIGLNIGNDLVWYISQFTVQYNDGENDVEYNFEYINIEFDQYEDGDIIIVDPE